MLQTCVHKDAPPSIFDIANRPIQHVVVLGVVIGFAVSVVTFAAYALATDRVQRNDSAWNAAQTDQAP